MAGTSEGRLKQAARQAGVSVEEYRAYVAAGLKFCGKCRAWRAVANFQIDRSRYDGLTAYCSPCRSQNPTRRLWRWGKATAWCAPCGREYPKSELTNSGLCRMHTNEALRTRYATDETYRFRIRQKVHARSRNVAPLAKADADRLLDFFGGCCAYCGGPAESWDHIVPVAKGGQTVHGNIVPACTSCNSSKRDRDVLVWADSQGYMLSIELLTMLQGGLPWER